MMEIHFTFFSLGISGISIQQVSDVVSLSKYKIWSSLLKSGTGYHSSSQFVYNLSSQTHSMRTKACSDSPLESHHMCLWLNLSVLKFSFIAHFYSWSVLSDFVRTLTLSFLVCGNNHLMYRSYADSPDPSLMKVTNGRICHTKYWLY